mmetsp:Transcript_76380/g.196703  ORF Transcript_76380/g.196703 Transcript_76380/m.196703 type:complete len:377 (+) Transcript_76380:79-1209(+)
MTALRNGRSRSPLRDAAAKAAAASGQPGQVDLRSDTVTKPTEAMRVAMASADVGDDVFGDDPTVIALQARTAAHFGFEAALFVPTGTMGNLICVLAHCWQRGSEIIVGDRAHIHIWEQGGCAQFGGVHPRAVKNQEDGTMKLEEIDAAVRGSDQHFPVTSLICLEDTHNMCGGKVLPLEYVDSVAALAKRKGVPLHLDGARVWNAIAASGVDPKRRLQPYDSASVCLSKGLGAPCGSVILGPADFIKRCHRLRKGLGGGMRQSGVLAAAALHAMDHHLVQFAVDHAHAKRLAEGFAALPGLVVNFASVQTNIVMIDFAEDAILDAPALVKELAARGVRAVALPGGRMRLCTHLMVDAAGIETAIKVGAEIWAAKRP